MDEDILIRGIIDDDGKRGVLIEWICIIFSNEFLENINDKEEKFILIYSFMDRNYFERRNICKFLQRTTDYMFVGEY